MRAIIALPPGIKAAVVYRKLQELGWETSCVARGDQLLEALQTEDAELLLTHACLPMLHSGRLYARLLESPCPPRVLLLTEPELQIALPADCIAPIASAPLQLFRLLCILAERPQSRAAMASTAVRREHICDALEELGFARELKGREYILTLLDYLVPNPGLSAAVTTRLYPLCAQRHHTTPAAVERCVRVAVEARFTHGDLHVLDRYFGATVDPERGKPTNREFIVTLANRVREDWRRANAEKA